MCLMIQFYTIAIIFCFVTPTSNRVSTMNDFQSYIRPIDINIIRNVHNRHARMSKTGISQPRDRNASEPRVTVVLIELLFQLMSTFIIRVTHTWCRSETKETRVPPKKLRLAHKSAEHSSSVVYVTDRDTMDSLSFSLFAINLCRMSLL